MQHYSKQFKDEALKLVTGQGYKPAEAARKLGIPDSTMAHWLARIGWAKDYAAPLSGDPKVLAIQVRDLQSANKRLQRENDILKKATAYFASQSL